MTEDVALRRRRREERDRSAPWIAVIAVAVALGVLLFVLLGGEDGDGDDIATPPVTTPATATESPTGTETPTETATEPTEDPTTTEPAEPTDDATPTTSPEPTDTATAEPTDTAAPTFEPVDPGDFHDEGLGAYFFTAFAEQLRCGLFTEGETRLSGCQATVVVPSLPECDDPDSNAPIVTLGETGPAFPECTTQGIFVVEETPELQVGQSITIDTITCSRDEDAVACHDDESGYGFLASPEEFTAVP